MSTVDTNLDVYLISDQPTTCGLCGSRTDFVVNDDGTQSHQCLNKDCKYQFIVVLS